MNTVQIIGYGKNETFEIGSYNGLPTHITAPRHIKVKLESIYRDVIGDFSGSVAWYYQKVRTIQPYSNTFKVSQGITFFLYRKENDNVGRPDMTTRRTFRVYTTHNYE